MKKGLLRENEHDNASYDEQRVHNHSIRKLAGATTLGIAPVRQDSFNKGSCSGRHAKNDLKTRK
jgi:hypothetical protein